MKRFTYNISYLLIALLLGSCQDWFDINTSKDTPASVTVDQALPVILLYSSQLAYDHAEYGVYLSQALTTGGKSQTGSYAYKSGWEFLTMNRHPQWRRHYYDIGVNNQGMMEAAEASGYKNIQLIGRTLLLNSTLLTTDAFGDMPRSKVYQSSSPPYDTQASIYEWMLQEADDLIALYNDSSWVNNAGNKAITSTMDRMFSGDMGKWRAFTKAIKARILIRKLPNWENTTATCTKIIDAVNDAINDKSYSDAIYKYDGGTTEKNCPWGPAQPTLNLGWAQARANLLTEAIPSKFLAYALLGAYVNTYSQSTRGYALDPRAARLMTPQSDGSSTLLRYLENNIGMPSSLKQTYYPDLYTKTTLYNPYTQNDGYIMLMSKEELLFIRAEAEYWGGDKTAAYNTTVEAVKTNMARLGVPNSTTAEKTIYNRFFTIKLSGESVFTIADLMQQKYVAMFLQPEQWTDMRRYNYSSKTNGISYDGVYVYTVKNIHNAGRTLNASDFSLEYSLTRPYNLYEAYWVTAEDAGTNAALSPNAWINRLNYDPETEDKYNKAELQRLGAYQNYEWLKKRMIWGYNTSGKAQTADSDEWK